MAVCKQCGQSKDNLSNHWRMSQECNYPDVTKKQNDVLTGILMGDGSLDRRGANSNMKIEMINKEYLEYVDEVLDNLSNGVYKTQSAEESASRMRNSGFRPDARAKNYSAVYRLTTKTHPKLNNFDSWYETGEKVIPKIELTPTILKHWYVCDGHLQNKNKNHRPRVGIGITNEYERSDKLEQMFIEKGLDANPTESKNLDIGVEHTEKFFEFIGEPVDGFKYKWP
jgi:hypothetical protein